MNDFFLDLIVFSKIQKKIKNKKQIKYKVTFNRHYLLRNIEKKN